MSKSVRATKCPHAFPVNFNFTSGDKYGYVKVIKCPPNSTNQTTMLNLKKIYRLTLGMWWNVSWTASQGLEGNILIISYKVIVICRNNYLQKSKNKYANNVSNTKAFLSCDWMFFFPIFDNFISAIHHCYCLQTDKKLWNKKTPVSGLFICLFGVFLLDAVSDMIIITSLDVVSHLCVARQKPSLRKFMKISLPWPFRLWKSSCY